MKFFLALACVFLSFLLVKGDDDESDETTVSITLWYGDDIESCSSKSFDVPCGCSLFKALQYAEKEDKNNFCLKTFKRFKKNYIWKIGNWAENILARKFWFVYVLKELPNNDNPPCANDLSKKGADDIIVNPNEHYLLWLRKHPGCK